MERRKSFEHNEIQIELIHGLYYGGREWKARVSRRWPIVMVISYG